MVRGVMHHLVPFTLSLATLGCAGILSAAEPPAKDREAILAMAGTHSVVFHFHETAAVAPGYEIRKKPYEETATEVIQVVEDTPTRIALQNLLVVPGEDGKPMVIKHWAQIWTWQDTELLDYSGSEEDHEWERVKLTPEQAKGTWSQLVTNIDDTPRYEGYGSWVHENGASYWQSQATRRPLPRREYSKRDDYDYLLVSNRHTLTPNGWIHEQDNRKIVDREGEPVQTLCHEFGLNTYTRTEAKDAEAALSWWRENAGFWDVVRNFWIKSGEAAASSFSYSSHENGEGLNKLLARMEKEKPSPDQVEQALKPYLVIR
jgi:hypothetical protein